VFGTDVSNRWPNWTSIFNHRYSAGKSAKSLDLIALPAETRILERSKLYFMAIEMFCLHLGVRQLAGWLPAMLVFGLATFSAWQPLLGDETPKKDARFKLVCSTTQTADFARAIVGDHWEVVSILAPGQDPHLYEIKPGDAQIVASADLCVENGWHLEGNDWMRKLATNAERPLVTSVLGIEALKVEESGDAAPDPHAWFSPKNAAVYVRNILAGVEKTDPDHKAEYRRRAGLYLEQLRSLHVWIRREVSAIPPQRRVLVTSHDAFHYFCRDYGFELITPVGWSTGDEVGGGATEARRAAVLKKIRDAGIPTVFTETSVSGKTVSDLANETGAKLGGALYSDSMGAEGTLGETYIGMMRENVLNIVHGLAPAEGAKPIEATVSVVGGKGQEESKKEAGEEANSP
jgi:manganese/iron transport system substrate-binding protein